MKKFIILVYLICICLISYSQKISGTWNGQLEIGGYKLRLIFHIVNIDSVYTGSMDSPDQGVNGIPITFIQFNPPDLSIEIENLGVSYKGVLIDSVINGIFNQSGVSFPLLLKKGEVVNKRPQEPQPPYSYRYEDIVFNNDVAKIQLSGTLTIPSEDEKYPAAILISGSGPQNRDEEAFGHKSFKVIADHLTKHGIVVLRYDDRGVGKSTGDFSKATTEDFMEDALSAFRYLKTRKEIDTLKIGLIGHSEGGKIAFMLASRNPQVAFIISMAGSLLPGDSIILSQNKALMTSHGFDNTTIDRYVNALREILRIKKSCSQKFILENIDNLTQNIISLDSLSQSLKDNLVSILTVDNPWFDYYITYDSREDIKNVSCPVLAINGDKDIQVDANINLQYIENILNVIENKNFILKKYDNLNHLFQECTTGHIVEYNQLEQTISPVVLNDITNWIFRIMN